MTKSFIDGEQINLTDGKILVGGSGDFAIETDPSLISGSLFSPRIINDVINIPANNNLYLRHILIDDNGNIIINDNCELFYI